MPNVLIPHESAGGSLPAELKHINARVWVAPEVAIQPPSDASSLQDAIENLFGYDWIILKNARATECFVQAFRTTHVSDQLDEIRVLAIGSRTVECASEHQIHVDIAVDRFATQSVASEIQSYVGGGSLSRLNLLVPSANISRESFQEQLQDAGARVDAVPTYRTCANRDELSKLIALIIGGGLDCVAFTSASAVEDCAALFDTDDLPGLFSGVSVVCGDEPTAQTAKEFGLNHTVIPAAASTSGIVEMIQHIASKG